MLVMVEEKKKSRVLVWTKLTSTWYIYSTADICVFECRVCGVWMCVTWKLLHSWSSSLCCSSHICVLHYYLLCTAYIETKGHQPRLLRGYSSHWRNVPHLNTHTVLSSFLYVQSMCIYVYVCIVCMIPTLWDVAAHHRHVALVYEVS